MAKLRIIVTKILRQIGDEHTQYKKNIISLST